MSYWRGEAIVRLLAAAVVTLAIGIGCAEKGDAPDVAAGREPGDRVLQAVALAQQSGQYAMAGAMIDSLAARFPMSARVAFLRGAQYDLTGFEDKAIAEYEKARDIDDTFAGAWHNLGSAFARQRQYGQALTAFQKAAALEPTAGAYQGVGNTWFELGEADSAVAALRKAIELDPSSVPVRLSLASIYRSKGETESEREVLAPCAAVSFDTECARDYSQVLLREGKAPAALDSLSKLVVERPWDKQVYFAYARSLDATGRRREAQSARERFAEIEAVDKEIFRMRERIALNPESLRDRFELADLYRKVGRPLDAVNTLEAALVLAPGNLHIRNNIGLLLLDSEQPEAAAIVFRQIMAIDSSFTPAYQNLERARKAAMATDGSRVR